MFANWTVDGTQYSIHFIKTGGTSKISQISGFQHHLQKTLFAMTDPVNRSASI